MDRKGLFDTLKGQMTEKKDNAMHRAVRTGKYSAPPAGDVEAPISIISNQVNAQQRSVTQKIYNFVPFDSVGDLVHLSFEAGMRKIIITPNKGGGSCTMVVEP